jgi:UDP-2-acetamido-3-amino-2,3-dideoxy-glucuronate N-acetyltransferase
MDKHFFSHPSAILDAGCSIGKDSKIWHFCHLMGGCTVGEQCILGQNVFVASGVRIGDRVKIQNNVSLYAGVILEDEVFVGPSAVFTNVINPRGGIERKDQFKTTLVRKGATIGANATIVCGNTIGAYALVGAGAVVTRDVPAYGLVIGNPARLKGWVSAAGHRLVFDASSRARCPETGEIYCLEHGLVRPENIPTN